VVLDAAVGVPASVTSVEATFDGLSRVGQAVGQGATRHEVRVAVDISPVQVRLGDVRKQDRGLPGADRSSGRTARVRGRSVSLRTRERKEASQKMQLTELHPSRRLSRLAAVCWDPRSGLPPGRNRRRGCIPEATEESRGRSRRHPESYDMSASSRTSQRPRLRAEGLRISHRRVLKELQANSHSSISPDSAVHVSIASWSTFRSQALTKSCGHALGDSARRSATTTCKRILLHVHRAIRSLRGMEGSQLLLHFLAHVKEKEATYRSDRPSRAQMAATCSWLAATSPSTNRRRTSSRTVSGRRNQHISKSRKDGDNGNAQRG
jgi:hypothetical protein